MFALARKPNSRPNSAEAPGSILSYGLIVRGHLEADGELLIHGAVEGRIDAERLVIAKDGFVDGDVVAREVRILGKVTGRIFALNVTLEETAEVQARIFHHSVTVATGARFEGRMPWRPPQFFETLSELPETQP
ncbi:MAG TPA: polymer-forming cytoskeletal protein [Rhizomicrobium sp.]|jgi:cytoskeletal protein CcmA (bactofilin family)